jgi:hypothetical protein
MSLGDNAIFRKGTASQEAEKFAGLRGSRLQPRHKARKIKGAFAPEAARQHLFRNRSAVP